MAARKRSAIRPGTMPQQWRDRIQTSMIVNRLTAHVKGDVDLQPTQVTAALGLLKKSLPDLSAQTLSGDAENPLHTVSRIETVVVDAQQSDSAPE
jgi:hypothetical protein